MVFVPFVVAASGRIGRRTTLRLCLAGAATCNALIACSVRPWQIIGARRLAGPYTWRIRQ